MSIQTPTAICSIPHCQAGVHAGGMCNPHYLIWYREQRQDLQDEVKRVNKALGLVANYFCDGADDCKEVPLRWWVRDGDEDEPQALCQIHTEQILYNLRREVRRLELKV
jgi:hypothetical protein